MNRFQQRSWILAAAWASTAATWKTSETSSPNPTSSWTDPSSTKRKGESTPCSWPCPAPTSTTRWRPMRTWPIWRSGPNPQRSKAKILNWTRSGPSISRRPEKSWREKVWQERSRMRSLRFWMLNDEVLCWLVACQDVNVGFWVANWKLDEEWGQ